MTKAKKSTCLYCKKMSVISIHFREYVCDDCYERNQIKKKEEMKYERNNNNDSGSN